ncbi:hypothetical protein BANRA_05451 [Klebsiella pneumoniae]|nr:hypothetical protein BANRA_05451 [Klebsiella pneumoniae]
MTDKDLYGGLIRLHILHHAAEEPVFGLIIEELRRHGYEMSAGTVYPMLHGPEKGYLTHATNALGDVNGVFMTSLNKAELHLLMRKTKVMLPESW